MYRYDGFTEIEGTFVPIPGLCHPALVPVAEVVRNNDEDFFVLDDPPLEFIRNRVIGTRWDGVDIYWDVWIDQYGRAVSSTSYSMVNI